MKKAIIFTIMMLAIGIGLQAQSPWSTVSAADVTFEYRIAADAITLEGKLSSATTGWIAVGFNPTSVMRDANIIIGYVSNDGTQIRDDWGNSNTSHVSDTSLGGVNNVTLIQGTEAGGNTTLHFTLPLVTTDQYDRPLMAGQTYPIILARGQNNADNYTATHANADFAQITLIAPVANEDETNLGLPAGRILSAYPNPFNPSTTIRYQVAKAGEMKLQIFNARGQVVYTSPPARHSSGVESFTWNGLDNSGNSCPSGIYTVRLSSAEGHSEQRITLMK